MLFVERVGGTSNDRKRRRTTADDGKQFRKRRKELKIVRLYFWLFWAAISSDAAEC